MPKYKVTLEWMLTASGTVHAVCNAENPEHARIIAERKYDIGDIPLDISDMDLTATAVELVEPEGEHAQA